MAADFVAVRGMPRPLGELTTRSWYPCRRKQRRGCEDVRTDLADDPSLAARGCAPGGAPPPLRGAPRRAHADHHPLQLPPRRAAHRGAPVRVLPPPGRHRPHVAPLVRGGAALGGG